MKVRLLIVAAMLLAGCATLQPQQTRAVSDTPTPKSQIKNRDRDLSECERESAFAGAGDKRKAFDSCMKALAGVLVRVGTTARRETYCRLIPTGCTLVRRTSLS